MSGFTIDELITALTLATSSPDAALTLVAAIPMPVRERLVAAHATLLADARFDHILPPNRLFTSLALDSAVRTDQPGAASGVPAAQRVPARTSTSPARSTTSRRRRRHRRTRTTSATWTPSKTRFPSPRGKCGAWPAAVFIGVIRRPTAGARGVPNPGLAMAGGLTEPMPEDRDDDDVEARIRNPLLDTKAQPVPVKAGQAHHQDPPGGGLANAGHVHVGEPSPGWAATGVALGGFFLGGRGPDRGGLRLHRRRRLVVVPLRPDGPAVVGCRPDAPPAVSLYRTPNPDAYADRVAQKMATMFSDTAIGGEASAPAPSATSDRPYQKAPPPRQVLQFPLPR